MERLVIVYLSYASDAGEGDTPEGEYPGYVMTLVPPASRCAACSAI